ncbi:GNAT family N-acetyltransferase [Microbacterium murale]|uniref:GNAT superfamily N-acetyltransferase n=1 Tax=Microbacterium murale TaxID=1081040 RepID=A0ABU0PDQ8_9MICO|nr:GNAT family N-acetyltransferase [Microbacterium murale]MDQ0645445.1 GNAT superfamily N-acetyltransferase [Microbacterium murale]
MSELDSRSRAASIRISTWKGDEEHLARAADLYAAVFAEPPYGDDPEASRVSLVERVRRRATAKPDFRLLLAWHGPHVVGLILGSGVAEGDWWRDRIVEEIPEAARIEWLRDTCFAVEELAIAPAYRRFGVAAALMDEVLQELPYPTAVLSCYAEAASARQFYRARGWEEFACDVRIGNSPALCVLGVHVGVPPRE